MMKKIVFLFIVFTLSVLNANAQDEVDWATSIKMLSDNEGYVILTAEIQPGWHMYGLELPKGGPKPTTLKFSTDPGVEFIGKLNCKPAATVSYDTSFNMELQWWTGKVTFMQKFKINSSHSGKINIEVRYMVCDDVHCLPPKRKNLEISLPAKS